MAEYTSDANVELAYTTLQNTFKSGKTKEIAWRKWQLKQIWWLVDDNQTLIHDALKKDLNRHPFETTLVECSNVKEDLINHLKNIDNWTADQKPNAGMMGLLLRPTVRPEPLGVALIIGPWNFPFSLMVQPLIAAITAGCAAMLKPSEVTTSVQQLFVDLVPKYLDPSAVRVVTGGPAETGRLLQRKFDHIFFTGSAPVARHIAAAAAKHLTPTVFELGGQCPAIVTSSADIDAAAKDIAWIKYLNAGQICLSVNHVFVHGSVERRLIERMAFWLDRFNKGDPDSMTHIINDRNYTRLKEMAEKTKGKVELDGTPDAKARSLPVSVVSNVELTDPLLSEELFGTICPVIKGSTDDAIESINSLPRPLALYIFSQDQTEVEHIISSTISGGVCVNGVLVHATVPNAPFGGVGESGHGAYHGDYGFKAFTHYRTIARPTPFFFRMSDWMRPPYSVNDIKKLSVRNSVGIKRNWSLEQEREAVKRGLLLARLLRYARFLAYFVLLLGLADVGLDRRMGVLRGVRDLFVEVRSFL
ncbi:aldehyde dehydrogenase family protein [Aspergillus mulundensis]|uniref:Aldehyde dehydrogenase n=1 Tax=Aspergillus mulundensis TaxID=1810919 RepID=A0A3D8QS29_9EURO|nr:Aldehyde dehydrogenase [Aspergillus mulundensis]RDW64491.1 Aldehyde dehydrogenase [Aspergillus mulundensis]